MGDGGSTGCAAPGEADGERAGREGAPLLSRTYLLPQPVASRTCAVIYWSEMSLFRPDEARQAPCGEIRRRHDDAERENRDRGGWAVRWVVSHASAGPPPQPSPTGGAPVGEGAFHRVADLSAYEIARKRPPTERGRWRLSGRRRGRGAAGAHRRPSHAMPSSHPAHALPPRHGAERAQPRARHVHRRPSSLTRPHHRFSLCSRRG